MAEPRDQDPSLSPVKRALHAVEDMKARLEALEHRQREPIAIIGLGCRMPGEADTPERFWELMRDGVDAVTEIPRERFDIDQYYHPTPGTPGKTHTRYGGFVKDIEAFDPVITGIAPKNGCAMDPQQRMFVEACWAAIEDAGIAPLSMDGTRTGVFVGVWSVEYWHRLVSRPLEELEGMMVGGNIHSMASGMVSYLFGLKGPSLSLDTACSSSLVAVDLAVQSLRTGASDMALAGGVNVILGPENYVSFSGMQVLSADGRCKAFDASADGFGRGEGVGAVLLKRLSDALADQDRILAVIHGSAVTQDGKTSGIAVPNGPSQEAAAREALRQARVRPADVAYVEAHGTGTSLGDPIEVIALGNVYGEGRSREDALLLGTVKTNIGHLESAAGIAGLIKVVLALQNEALPPNLHFKRPNPEIPWDELPVEVVTQLRPWPRGAKPRYAAVSSFGVSGTNAHLLVGEAPAVERPRPSAPERHRHVLVLSTKDKEALVRSAGQFAKHLGRHPGLDVADVCFTANTGRSAFRERLAVVGRSVEELGERLAAFAHGKSVPGLLTGRARATGQPAVGFLFTGQGSQYLQMGRGLYETEPAFRAAMERCNEILRPRLDVPLLDVVYAEPGASSPLDDTAYTQPALFALEYALAELWRSWGVHPAFVLGHSVGEYAAACVAGVFSLEDGLTLIAERARLMSALPREGRMVAIMADEARVASAIEPLARDVSIAALNGPESVVISGRAEAVEAVARGFQGQGVETRPLNVSHAFHSPLMEPVRREFERVARQVRYREPHVALVSNLTGAVAGHEIAIPEYWISHVMKPVRFADGIAALHGQGCELFLEIGPKPVLSGMGADCLPRGAATFLSSLGPTGGAPIGQTEGRSLGPGQDDGERALSTLGELFVRGVTVDWKAFDQARGRTRLALPTYPFKRERYWVEAGTNGHRSGTTSGLAALIDGRERGRIADELRKTGRFSEDEARLLVRLLDVFAEEYERRASAEPAAYKTVVADYYNTVRNLTPEIRSSALEEVTEAYLTFAPLPEVVPGYSWVLAMIDEATHPEWARLTLEGQRNLRDAVFRKVDFGAVRKMLDFGCGYASDLCTLALKHPHLEGTGYTLSGEQMKVGLKKIERLGLTGRVHIHNCDSTKDEFPEMYELAFGFEVAHHVPNKRALFGHISRHLLEGGKLVMADFISRTGFAIEYDAMSSYFPTTDEWVELFSDNQLLAVDTVDISREMSHFLYDPSFDQNVAALMARPGADVEALRAMKSYDRLGKMHAQGLALYVLFTVEKRSDLALFELKRLNRQVLQEPTPFAEISIQHACYEVEWVRKDRTAAPTTNGQPGRWLILADRGGVGEALARRLDAAGQRTVVVDRASAYHRAAADRFTVDPAQRSDFDRLLEEATPDGAFRGVVHLWSLDATANDALDLASLRDAQMLGCGSVINLVQALGEAEGPQKPRTWLVTEQAQAVGDGPVQVAQTPLFGLGKALSMESPELWGGMVDVEAGGPDAKAAAVLRELASPDGEIHVAYRRGERFVPRVVRRAQPEAQRPPVRPDASYLVAGGTGGLGLVAARWLADEGARHLILTSRRGATEAGREEIRALESRGVEVVVATADVTSEKDMRTVIERVVSSMPPLRGVINSSGITGGAVLAQQPWDGFLSVLDVKVAGSWNLHTLTRGLPLDFFVCFSSVASFLGSPGQASYAAGNAFKDALGHHRVRSGMPGLTVNWGAWGQVGMAAAMPDLYRRTLLQASGLGEIDPRDGARILGRLIAEGRPQVAVFQQNWVKFFANVTEGKVPPYLERVAPRTERAVLAEEAKGILDQVKQAPAEEHLQVLGHYVQERVAKILGYSDPAQVDRELTLLELGFDSLMAVQLRNQIRTNLQVDVPVGRLFDSTSIDQLSHLLRERVGAGAPRHAGEQVEVI